ncbi:HTH-type transcriptional regulator CymR [Pseudobythopirellula maris]|uniref:HTH-type transcriptional regulator CymR n=1 Tax=Pseudobythopirellula maris TaxID=2527991 RepID=A0A5C5ZMD5_9BACT|nr:Rrf2 family transcriptional regulator [Pseudobythopirellula maris]TWT87603.1 HTH-type transcriptional regulator CymR [Pseudobythopirellula maris]
MKISRTVAYAIQALMQLANAEPGCTTSCNSLSKRGKMPERFLLQILRNLVRHGMLKSVRGVEGGYVLIKSPEQISLLSLCEALDHGLEPVVPEVEGLSPQTRDALLGVVSKASSAASHELSEITLQDLLRHDQEHASASPPASTAAPPPSGPHIAGSPQRSEFAAGG